MVAINDITREKIKVYLNGFLDGVIEANKRRKGLKFESAETYLDLKSTKAELKPFHAAIIPTEFMAFSGFERSFSTTLGTTFEQCAYLIASDYYPEVQRAYVVSENVSNVALRELDRQIDRFHRAREQKSVSPSLEEMILKILDARDVGETSLKTTLADLYIKTQSGVEYFFELKTPVPNKDICHSLLSRILCTHLLRGLPRPQVQSYAAFAYNPYGGTRGNYRWSVAKMYLPFEQATLIGDEFWHLIGGETTYVELLEIYAEVGRDKSLKLIESLRASE